MSVIDPGDLGAQFIRERVRRDLSPEDVGLVAEALRIAEDTEMERKA